MISGSSPFAFQESQMTVGRGRVRLGIAAGGGGGAVGIEEYAAGGQIRLRYGVADSHEVGLTVYGAWLKRLALEKNEGTGDFPDHFVMSSKIDYKWQVHDNVSILFGTGGGFQTTGAFMNGDLGVLIGLRRVLRVPDRRVRQGILPYAGIRGSLSVPIYNVLDEDHKDRQLKLTGYFGGALGISVPFSVGASLVAEVGGSAIFAEEVGGAGYGTVGLDLSF